MAYTFIFPGKQNSVNPGTSFSLAATNGGAGDREYVVLGFTSNPGTITVPGTGQVLLISKLNVGTKPYWFYIYERVLSGASGAQTWSWANNVPAIGGRLAYSGTNNTSPYTVFSFGLNDSPWFLSPQYIASGTLRIADAGLDGTRWAWWDRTSALPIDADDLNFTTTV